ncbi:transmembrane protein, putative [Bodo saltans]|uniref:Alpha-1,3-glucosyltransferase n=1 Tax=Bodo saltans TaxID=75058 RepID=A0A0S4J6X1_BODSA|nr:transmembrane protein, putative [Bodo saltans]|eukprot:CUG49463.1 transmembrane protein, putative [Bodo saltans]
MASSPPITRVILCVALYAVLLFGPKCMLWYVAVHNGKCVVNPHRQQQRVSNLSAPDQSIILDCSRVPIDECCGTAYSPCSFQAGLYHSSDFEVHRNWLSIVSERHYSWLREEGSGEDKLSLVESLRYWYRENTSLWTLDYPPLFAWFEFAMSQILLPPPDNDDGRNVVVSQWWFPSSVCSAQSSVDLSQLRKAAGLPLSSVKSRRIQEAPPPLAIPLHSSQGIVAFQRATVIIFSDVPYFLATVILFVAGCRSQKGNAAGSPSIMQLMMPLIAACCPAWTIIDNIHFQYNGIIFAVFMLSVYLAYCNRPYAAAICYGILVFLKHMMAYFALGYALWGVAVALQGGSCCRQQRLKETTKKSTAQAPRRATLVHIVLSFLQFGGAVALVVLVAVGPFALSEYMFITLSTPSTASASLSALVAESTSTALQPVKERLFPFGRGLVHAYWAPNAYAVYSTADFALCKILQAPTLNQRLPPMVTVVLQGMFPNAQVWCGKTSVNTKGLVGLEASSSGGTENVTELMKAPTHAALPPLTPLTSNMLVVGCFVSGVVWLVFVRSKKKGAAYLRTLEWWSSPEALLWGTFWSACSFFLFSWHVHEKAILSVILPVFVFSLRRSPAAWTGAQQCDDSCSNALHLCFRLNLIATAAVFPLMFSPLENAIKYTLFGTLAVVPYAIIFHQLGRPRRALHIATMVAAGGLTIVSLWVDQSKMATFAPLMVMSFLGALTVLVTMFMPLFWQ